MPAKAERLTLDDQIAQPSFGERTLFVEASDERAALVGFERGRFEQQQRALSLLHSGLELAAGPTQRVGDLRRDLAFERGQIACARETLAQLGIPWFGRAFRGTYARQ